jgi:hypothetical protein
MPKHCLAPDHQDQLNRLHPPLYDSALCSGCIVGDRPTGPRGVNPAACPATLTCAKSAACDVCWGCQPSASPALCCAAPLASCAAGSSMALSSSQCCSPSVAGPTEARDRTDEVESSAVMLGWASAAIVGGGVARWCEPCPVRLQRASSPVELNTSGRWLAGFGPDNGCRQAVAYKKQHTGHASAMAAAHQKLEGVGAWGPLCRSPLLLHCCTRRRLL